MGSDTGGSNRGRTGRRAIATLMLAMPVLLGGCADVPRSHHARRAAPAQRRYAAARQPAAAARDGIARVDPAAAVVPAAGGDGKRRMERDTPP